MTDQDLVNTNDRLWYRCETHDQIRDDRICPGCAAEARPGCTYCAGTGTLTHHSGGLEWPETCDHCRSTWPYPWSQLEPPGKDEL